MSLQETIQALINPAPSPAGARMNDILRIILDLDKRITRLEQANMD